MTADVRRTPRRGTSSRMRHRAYAPARGTSSCLPSGRRVLRSVLRPVRVDPHYARPVARRFVVGRSFSVSRLGKPTRVGGTSTGVGRTGAARLAACHRIRKGEGVTRQKRKEVEASVPARIAEPRLVIRTSCFRCCRSRQATSDLEYARQTRSKKGGQGRVNGGLARSEGRRVIPSAGASGERIVACRAHPLRWGEHRQVAQGGARAPFSGRSVAKAGGRSRDRGCNDHRIL